MGSDPLSEDRLYRLHNEQAFLRVTEFSISSGGLGERRCLQHRLLGHPDIVVKALESSEQI